MSRSSLSSSQAEAAQPGSNARGRDLREVTPPRHRKPDPIQRLAFAGVLLLLVVGMAPGLAYAADGAKPGDLMYGLDRAFEVVGYSDGGVRERLAEVEALISAGAVTEALHHASEVIDGRPGSDEGRAALIAAAARSKDAAVSRGSQPTQGAALVEYLKRAVVSNQGVDGQTVAEMARDLGASTANPTGPPTEPGSGGSDRGGPPTEPGSGGSDRGNPPTEPGAQGP